MLKKLLMSGFLISGLFSIAYADPASSLTQLLTGMRSMQASFSQSIVDKKGKVVQQSTGRMALQRPGQFRWDTQRPVKQLIVTNGKRLWIYDPDLDQVTIRNLSKAAGATPAMLLSSENIALDKEFVVQAMNNGSSILQWYVLTPRNKNSSVAVLKLGFANQTIREMKLQDHLGHATAIQFSNAKLNAPLSASLFTFKPPARVDVIDETKR